LACLSTKKEFTKSRKKKSSIEQLRRGSHPGSVAVGAHAEFFEAEEVSQ
jgi:hypothetical protein